MFQLNKTKVIYLPQSLDKAQTSRLAAWLRQTVKQFGMNLLQSLAPWPV